MGQSFDVLKTCDGGCGNETNSDVLDNQRPVICWDEDVSVGCGVLEDGMKHCVATANRGGNRISEEVLLNHELLQHARQGNVKGVSDCLEKGAWTETRRPLVMKSQKPELNKGGGSSSEDGGAISDIGMTALMFSAQCGSEECISRLLWAASEVNAVEEDGWSALHFAAKEGHLAVCTTLLQSRAETQLLNADGKTPLQVAKDEDEDFARKLTAVLAKGKH